MSTAGEIRLKLCSASGWLCLLNDVLFFVVFLRFVLIWRHPYGLVPPVGQIRHLRAAILQLLRRHKQ